MSEIFTPEPASAPEMLHDGEQVLDPLADVEESAALPGRKDVGPQQPLDVHARA